MTLADLAYTVIVLALMFILALILVGLWKAIRWIRSWLFEKWSDLLNGIAANYP